MKLRTKRRALNYSRLYNQQLATVLEAAYEDFRVSFAKDGESLSESLDSLQKLGASYRHFRKFALRFSFAR